LRKQARNGIDQLEQKEHDKETLRIQQRNSKTFSGFAEVITEREQATKVLLPPKSILARYSGKLRIFHSWRPYH